MISFSPRQRTTNLSRRLAHAQSHRPPRSSRHSSQLDNSQLFHLLEIRHDELQPAPASTSGTSRRVPCPRLERAFESEPASLPKDTSSGVALPSLPWCSQFLAERFPRFWRTTTSAAQLERLPRWSQDLHTHSAHCLVDSGRGTQAIRDSGRYASFALPLSVSWVYFAGYPAWARQRFSTSKPTLVRATSESYPRWSS